MMQQSQIDRAIALGTLLETAQTFGFGIDVAQDGSINLLQPNNTDPINLGKDVQAAALELQRITTAIDHSPHAVTP